jgi:hypothetical protein
VAQILRHQNEPQLLIWSIPGTCLIKKHYHQQRYVVSDLDKFCPAIKNQNITDNHATFCPYEIQFFSRCLYHVF